MLCVAKREYQFQKNGLKGIAIGRIKKKERKPSIVNANTICNISSLSNNG